MTSLLISSDNPVVKRTSCSINEVPQIIGWGGLFHVTPKMKRGTCAFPGCENIRKASRSGRPGMTQWCNRHSTTKMRSDDAKAKGITL